MSNDFASIAQLVEQHLRVDLDLEDWLRIQKALIELDKMQEWACSLSNDGDGYVQKHIDNLKTLRVVREIIRELNKK